MAQIVSVAGVPLGLDMPALVKELKLEGKTALIRRLERLAAAAVDVARPKAAARLSALNALDADRMRMDHVILTSPLMVQHMAGLGRAFPYLVTEGRELHEWALGLESRFDVVVSAFLREIAPAQYLKLLEEKLLQEYGMRQLSLMSPGSLAAWPIEQQGELFRLLAPVPERLGVALLPSFMMKPEYSESGVFFETEKKFYNCRLCPQPACRDRQAAYRGG